MLRIGDAVPKFEGTAVLDCQVASLAWDQIHDHNTLILVFDSIEDASEEPDRLAALSRAAERLEMLNSKLAVICRDELFEILAWADHLSSEIAPRSIGFPLIVDADSRIASLYEMLSPEGVPLWGYVIANSDGRIRSIDVNSVPLGVNADELVRFALSVEAENHSGGSTNLTT